MKKKQAVYVEYWLLQNCLTAPQTQKLLIKIKMPEKEHLKWHDIKKQVWKVHSDVNSKSFWLHRYFIYEKTSGEEQ